LPVGCNTVPVCAGLKSLSRGRDAGFGVFGGTASLLAPTAPEYKEIACERNT
jgi:hypothetical protein